MIIIIIPHFSYLPWFKIFYELLNRISDIKRGNEVHNIGSDNLFCIKCTLYVSFLILQIYDEP